MGIGMVVIVSAKDKERVMTLIRSAKSPVYEIGRVVKGKPEVVMA
jgi:phosphoribosylaminoimidazole (AIR) synthetase